MVAEQKTLERDRHRCGRVLGRHEDFLHVRMAAQEHRHHRCVVLLVWEARGDGNDHSDGVLVFPRELGSSVPNAERNRVETSSGRSGRRARPVDAFRDRGVAGKRTVAARAAIGTRPHIQHGIRPVAVVLLRDRLRRAIVPLFVQHRWRETQRSRFSSHRARLSVVNRMRAKNRFHDVYNRLRVANNRQGIVYDSNGPSERSILLLQHALVTRQ